MSDLLDLLDDMTTEYLPCGCKAGTYWRGVRGGQEYRHATECLGGRCPDCHLDGLSGYELVQEHAWLDYWQQCQAQHWAYWRQGHCMSCRWPTFGQWPCRNEECEYHAEGTP